MLKAGPETPAFSMWCPRRESNPHLAGLKPAASVRWATGANVEALRGGARTRNFRSHRRKRAAPGAGGLPVDLHAGLCWGSRARTCTSEIVSRTKIGRVASYTIPQRM